MLLNVFCRFKLMKKQKKKQKKKEQVQHDIGSTNPR